MSKNEENKETGIKLNEAIERFTSNAEFERTQGNLQGCLNFRQLAEWLKDYKRLLEQEPKTVLYSGDGYADGYMVYDMAECPNCGYEYEDGDKDWGLSFCPNCGQKLDWESEG